jgi:hypothetical protein
MPSNKNRDKMKQQTAPVIVTPPQVELTGKNEVVYHTCALCPVLENDKIVYKIVDIGFTLSGQCVSIETRDSTDSQGEALSKYELHDSDSVDIRSIRKIAKAIREGK